MSDIPLKTLGRNQRSKEGYTQLADNEEVDTEENISRGGSQNGNRAMPVGVRPAATIKGKAPIRTPKYNYKDDPEEEERLLSGHEREESFEHETQYEQRRGGKGKQSSRTVSSFR